MPDFRRASRERINVFRVSDAFLFKHYVSESAFSELNRYYDDYEYRFEVPPDRFVFVRSLLREHGYAPVVQEDHEPFAVLKRKYTNHPEVLFEKSVYQRDLGNFNCFIMKDRTAVEEAIDSGAIPIEETDHEL